MQGLTFALGIAAVTLLVAVLAVRVSVRLGLPSLLLYLAIGLLLGESGFGIRFDNVELTQVLGIAALVMILTEGGLTTRFSAVKPALGVGITLSTVAVGVSIAVAGVGLHLLLELDWQHALLWGAVLAPTDAAAVFSVLRGLGVSKRLVGALELESGINDAPSYIAVVLLAEGSGVNWSVPLMIGYE
ncbi:MAG: cation:proton antiporter, partial [Sciscionella sp.]